MAEEPARRSALADRPRPAATAPELTLTERPAMTVIHLSLPGGGAAEARPDRDAAERLGASLGLALPSEPNRAVTDDGRTVLWAGPGRWLLVSARDQPGPLAGLVREALPDPAAVTDVSHGFCVIRVAGQDARALLAKGCSLDLHPRHFTPGRCAHTEIRGIYVVLHAVDATPCVELYVQRSFAASLWDWLADAALEFGA